MIGLMQTTVGVPHSVHLTFATEFPIWVFGLLTIMLVALVLWTMPVGRLEPIPRRILLTCRMIAMGVGLVILARPSWTSETKVIQSDIVPILLDSSASMSMIEHNQSSRFDDMRLVISKLVEETQALASDTHRSIKWFTFANTIESISINDHGDILMPLPAGGPTMIGASLSTVFDGLDSDRVAGVVVVTDGRGVIGDVEAQFRMAGIGVWVVPIGDVNPPPAITLHQVTAPHTVFSEDTIPLQVVLKRTDGDSGVLTPITIRVVDDTSGTTLTTINQEIEANILTSINIMMTPDIPGLARWNVSVWSNEQLLDSAVVEVDIRDRPLRLLYVEGKPRFFYRFAVPLFTRERSVDVSVLLLSADEDAAPVGDHPIRRFPRSTMELEPFDLVVLGDVDPGAFTEGQLQSLRAHILDGAGLLWVPGSHTQPDVWLDTPLEALLPISPMTRRHIVHGRLRSTPEGTSLGLVSPVDTPLAWAVAVDDHLPQSRVLMNLIDDDGLVWPGFVLLPTGKGHVGWLATDDTWRWRRSGDDDHSGSLIMGIMRLLARQVAPSEPVLRVMPQAIIGQPTTIVLDGEHDSLPMSHALLEVEIMDEHGVLRQRVQLTQDGDAATKRDVDVLWRGVWQPESSGIRHLIVANGDRPIQQTVLVLPDSAEDMQAGVDMIQLEALARHTGGKLIDSKETATILSMIPRRSSRTIRVNNEGPALIWLLWSTLVATLAIDWSIRRWNALA